MTVRACFLSAAAVVGLCLPGAVKAEPSASVSSGASLAGCIQTIFRKSLPAGARFEISATEISAEVTTNPPDGNEMNIQYKAVMDPERIIFLFDHAHVTALPSDTFFMQFMDKTAYRPGLGFFTGPTVVASIGDTPVEAAVRKKAGDIVAGVGRCAAKPSKFEVALPR